jgi:uncharacterized protein (DUF488 family)
MDIIYTIGHSNHVESKFIELIQLHKIQIVLDVRSSPYSQRFPQFNRDDLKNILMKSKMEYAFFGEWFGARQPDKAYYTSDGWLNYLIFTKSLIFNEGVNRLDIILGKGLNPVLLCAEKDPFNCHRAIMVSRALSLKGYEIRHVLEDGKILTQAELDLRILNKYFPKRDEGSIFDIIEGEKDTDTLMAEAYYKRNEAIAWRMDGSEEY